MTERNAIMELEVEQHRVEGLASAVDDLIWLMRDLPDEPSAEVIEDLQMGVEELRTHLTSLFDDEEDLIFPAIRAHFKQHGRTVKELVAEHQDLRLSLRSLSDVVERLSNGWRLPLVEQAWALADHIRYLFQEHTDREDELLDGISEQLTLPEHDELLKGLRARRNGRNLLA